MGRTDVSGAAWANPAHSTWAPVTTPAFLWKARVYVPTGKLQPGVRSPQILIGEIVQREANFGIVN